MADGKGGGGVAVLIAVLIGAALALADGQLTSSSSVTGPTSESSTVSTTGTSTVSRPSSTTTVTSNSTVVVTNDTSETSGTGRAPAPLSACPGRVVGEMNQNGLTLRVFYDSQARGTNCVAAAHQGPVTAPGFLRIEIRTDGYTGTQWPRYATRDGEPGSAEVAGAYLIGTDGHCVSATATYFPSGAGGSSSSISLAGVGCG